MANREEELMRLLCQSAIASNAARGTLAFDKSEFSRLPADPKTMSQITSEDVQKVADALHRSLTIGFYSMVIRESGPSAEFIAAQFKNTNMRESKLEPKVIEAALTKIIDNLDEYPQLKAIKCTLSYNDDGSGMAAKGVRTFCIKGRD